MKFHAILDVTFDPKYEDENKLFTDFQKIVSKMVTTTVTMNYRIYDIPENEEETI